MTDLLLLNEIKKGNSKAYKELFLKYYSSLCEYASCFLSDADAEELVQELMLYVWESREFLVIESSVKAYFFRSVKNRSFNIIRNNKHKAKVHTAMYEKLREQFESPDYYFIDELERNIQKAIQALPENYRITFEMSRFLDLTNLQIAEELNVSVKTVEYRITRSLKLLKENLKNFYNSDLLNGLIL